MDKVKLENAPQEDAEATTEIDATASQKYSVEGGKTPVGGGDDPFDLANISVASVTAEDLGVEKPILVVPVE